MSKEKSNWRKLDNSAKIFPLMSGKKYSSVFRFSVVLKEKINPQILQLALNRTIQKFEAFKVKLSKGFFWFYLEENQKELEISRENTYPCKYINPTLNNEYLLKVTYFNNKINVDIFHSLTDGNSGMKFIKELAYQYIEIAHENVFKHSFRSEDIKKYDNTQDEYINNYDKHNKKRDGGKKAYEIKGKEFPLLDVGVIHHYINLEQLRTKCKQIGVTITQYLTANLIYAIYEGNYKQSNGKKQIRICVPVSLEKYIKSNTIANFFSYISVDIDIKKIEDEIVSLKNINEADEIFYRILNLVKQQFENKLQKEEIIKTMSANVNAGTNIASKIAPLFIKIPLVRLAYTQIRKYSTTTLSNVGRVNVMPEYKEYIDHFLMLISPGQVEKIKCSACSFENKLVFTFTSILNEIQISDCFKKYLIKNGIETSIESNGVYGTIS